MTEPFVLTDRLQVRTAMLAIGRSTLRNQGAAGMVAHARSFLRAIDLGAFSSTTQKQFARLLDSQTKRLANGFPGDGRGNWGAARKSMNIFLRDVVYCRPLCEHYRLVAIEPWLEVPLDSNVYDGLVSDWEDPGVVPPWPGVRALTPSTSRVLQRIATAIAESMGTARVHLDVRYWRRGEMDALAG